ncbi:GM16243 [Drosophila sechellia]|uniref:GM16243 n=2 Tax=Drosophila sechellia TaxID=7238 RepID=B4I922_DROSE|nr:GM19067 [Drosophila sechellia]EDW46300.1 GM16244 [Drosophila sechellia]EDW46302.1 GM16243 [Drosophila sechellia]
MLFNGATGNGQQGQDQNALNPLGQGQEETALFEQYYLLGDGSIGLRNHSINLSNPSLKSRCCQLPTLIHDICVNCVMDLCEECGYSCGECSKFICRNCVTLFGNRVEEEDDPLCELCQMFFS